MIVTGIIAEYNPFHNGHKYHIQEAKRLTGADHVIVIMSGDFVQRGAPAIYSKYLRAKTALLAGADLVLEMPVFGSSASAEEFARCGVSLLSHTGVASFLCFGSESGDIKLLEQSAEMLDSETEDISVKLREGLRSGLTFPKARELAFGGGLSAPNDILGCEYIRFIRRHGLSLTPVTITRKDPGYHSPERSGSFASATAARKAIAEQDLLFLQEILPTEFFTALSEESCPPVYPDDLSLMLNDRLLSSSLKELLALSDMPSDLAAKLYKNRRSFQKTSRLAAEMKDRHYTLSRVSRCLTALLLNITKDETAAFKAMDSAPWLRILGFRKEAAPLLSAMKKNADIPIFTKTANAPKLLSTDALQLFEKHVLSADRYRLAAELKTGHPIKNEYTRSVIIVG